MYGNKPYFHLRIKIRNSVAKILRKGYQAFTESLVVSNRNNSIDTLFTFYNYPTSIRKCIYTIN